MSKKVEVYNTYFGDCIVLKDRDDDSNLLVDFGIHRSSDISSVYGTRRDLHTSIAEDIAKRYSSSNISLLITHFHEDHVSGLIHMYKSENNIYKNMFTKIYIANIWNNPYAVASNLLEEMIVEQELKKSGLPGTTSLFDVQDFLSVNVYRVHLIKRGDLFENDKYIALWPIVDDRKNYISEIIQSFGLPEDFESGLIALSEIVCNFVTKELLGPNNSYEYINENISITQRILDMRITYSELLDDLVEHIFVNQENDLLRVQKEKLNRLNHKYNIVFQNTVCDNENILFTGDIEVNHMDEIAKAKDITLFKEYKYIKIPHHGTERHYFDYSKYNPQKVIITNGKVKTKDANSYKICSGYGNLNAIHLCSNSNHCANCKASCMTAGCVCARERRLVYGNLYNTI